jgi:hypothetical protein
MQEARIEYAARISTDIARELGELDKRVTDIVGGLYQLEYAITEYRSLVLCIIEKLRTAEN